MGKFRHVFKPLKIGAMIVKNRIEMAPVGPLLAAKGLVSPELIEWGRALASGGVAIVTLGDSAVILPPDRKPGNALYLGTDDAINPLNSYTEAIHKYKAKASIQLNCYSESSPTEMKPEEINRIIKSFATAAYRCMSADMDIVMVHGAHGQLISRFASPMLNHRTDCYGGNPENRARFAIEILEAIREKVGDRLAIEYRISADEFIPEGLKTEEQLEFAKLIQDRIDLLHVSAGNLFRHETLPRMIQPTYFPHGINVDFAAMFKQELKIPVTAVGSLDLGMAEEILTENKADMVAMARTLIADPDCIKKAEGGNENNIRPCVRCNTCIDRTHNHRLSIRCAVNPVCGREIEFNNLPLPTSGKKVIVVGGGPSGMEAARTAADQGHEVVLFEKNTSLGGNLAIASAAPFKSDMKNYLDWAIRSTTNTPRLTIRLSTEATRENITVENPDILILAIGSVPIEPTLPAINRDKVTLAGDVAEGKKEAGKQVVVVGAGLTGSETALLLAQQGKKVSLIDTISLEEIDAGYPYISILALRSLLRDLNVDIKTEINLVNISETGVVITDKRGKLTEIHCDTVVLAMGLEPRREMIERLAGLALQIFLVGDCNNDKGTLQTAVSEGFWAGMSL